MQAVESVKNVLNRTTKIERNFHWFYPESPLMTLHRSSMRENKFLCQAIVLVTTNRLVQQYKISSYFRVNVQFGRQSGWPIPIRGWRSFCVGKCVREIGSSAFNTVRKERDGETLFSCDFSANVRMPTRPEIWKKRPLSQIFNKLSNTLKSLQLIVKRAGKNFFFAE